MKKYSVNFKLYHGFKAEKKIFCGKKVIMAPNLTKALLKFLNQNQADIERPNPYSITIFCGEKIRPTTLFRGRPRKKL
jgi:hypothetical protein